jgi:nitrite reductase (cytochrome c-552)
MGATKVSDHHVRSPLLNINRSCQGCHKVPEGELKQRVEVIQGKVFALRNQAMDALMALIADLKAAKEAGRPDAELEAARYLQRRATFYLDFVEAENSTGFHAPQEATRILGEAIDYARQGQVALRDPKFKPTVKVVAIDTKPAPAPPAAAVPAPAVATAPAAKPAASAKN